MLFQVGKATCLDHALRTSTTVVHQPQQIIPEPGLDSSSATPVDVKSSHLTAAYLPLTATVSNGLGRRRATPSSWRYSQDTATTSSEGSDFAVMSTTKSPRVNKEKRHSFVSLL